jgi:chaperonin GroEL (HSP60 family)
LAIKAYAEAFEVIPRTLIENAGLDPLDYLATLRQSHVTEPQGKWFGFDVPTKKICNMSDLGIYDSYRVKLHAIKAADEITRQILNIDDVIHAKPAEYETPEDEEEI